MFDILYPKFVTDWKKRSLAVVYREMEEGLEEPRTHKSSSPAVLTSPLESSRPGMDRGASMPPSPVPARGAFYTDQCGETVLGMSAGDSLAKMNYVAKFLQGVPRQDGEYADGDRYTASNWRNAGTEREKLNASFSTREREFSSPRDRDLASDGYSSEGTKDESAKLPSLPSDRCIISRSPRMDSKNSGIHLEMTEGGNSVVDDGGRGDENHSQFQNYLKAQTRGYDLDMLDPESRYRSPYGQKFSMMPTSMEDNPLAAMLQKFAVSGSSDRFSGSSDRFSGSGDIFSSSGDRFSSSGDRFSLSPSKNVAPVTASSLYSGKGLPKKRRFRSDMVFPSTISYGFPSLHSQRRAASYNGGVENGSGHPDVFICHICSFVATSNEDFKAHMTIHYDYQCPQCTYSSRTEGRLKRHVKDFHGSSDQVPGQDESPEIQQSQKPNIPKKFKCRQCHFISFSREEHWNHITVHIKKEKQLKCIHCPFVTEFKHHLEYHIRNHNNSKPYKCGKCNYMCVNKSMLNSHMKSHTNVYQFRCASCKYATKYSHSLKLHLINKRHVAAVVLNPDGSLPTDGSGNFELISKRGPPRGPRGPRRSKSVTGDMSPPGLLPVFPTSSSPTMSLTQGSEYPWIPAQNGKPHNGVAIPGALPPINGALLSTAGTLPSQSLGYPLNILSQLSSAVTPPGVGYSTDRMAEPASVPCGFCPAVFGSLALLADHVKMEHAQKLCGFGVKLEAKSPTQEPTSEFFPDRSQCERKIYSEQAICHQMQGWTPRPDTNVFTSRNVEVYPDKGEIEIKKNSIPETAEIPLDLSSKNSDDVKRMAVKRSAVDTQEEDLSNAISPSVSAKSRKRSRKGKACKLDELSLKLQDHWKEENGVLDGSESSSLDDDCPPGLKLPSAGKESERKFSEVGRRISSSPPPLPPATSLNDSGSWSWKKESPQHSDAESSDQHRAEKSKTEARAQTPKPTGLSDREPGSDNRSEGLARSRAKSNTPTRQPPDNGYYTCNYCDMGFRDNITHFLHMGYHTYDDPFKCNKCGHRSNDAVDFFVHMARVAHTQ